MRNKSKRGYQFACWQRFEHLPDLTGYHIHLFIPTWLAWLGWLLKDQIIVRILPPEARSNMTDSEEDLMLANAGMDDYATLLDREEQACSAQK